jgi:hypothetical protein
MITQPFPLFIGSFNLPLCVNGKCEYNRNLGTSGTALLGDNLRQSNTRQKRQTDNQTKFLPA